MAPKRGAVIAAVVLLVIGIGSYAAYGLFTGASSGSFSVSTATFDLSLGLNRLTIDATGLTPGSVVQRALTINVTGSTQMQTPTLETVATASSLLDTDTTNGLQMWLDSCSQPWDETLTSGVPTAYSCAGVQTGVFGEKPIIQSSFPVGLDLTPGASNYLVFSFHLPDTADASFANLSSTIQFTFVANQRDPDFR
jgi:hypothetical protein